MVFLIDKKWVESPLLGAFTEVDKGSYMRQIRQSYACKSADFSTSYPQSCNSIDGVVYYFKFFAWNFIFLFTCARYKT